MKKLGKFKFFSDNLINKRNFFVNLLIISSLTFVLFKNIDNIRYTYLSSDDGKICEYDRFFSTLRLNE
ncbi:MAG: hypothetical protein CM15mP118_1560 [Alphaproteobacteria bacterium]|nr:MAG: hypothetical protein CM15mP118_1560 [Alphaproteobacteria bacterium]